MKSFLLKIVFFLKEWFDSSGYAARLSMFGTVILDFVQFPYYTLDDLWCILPFWVPFILQNRVSRC